MTSPPPKYRKVDGLEPVDLGEASPVLFGPAVGKGMGSPVFFEGPAEDPLLCALRSDSGSSDEGAHSPAFWSADVHMGHDHEVEGADEPRALSSADQAAPDPRIGPTTWAASALLDPSISGKSPAKARALIKSYLRPWLREEVDAENLSGPLIRALAATSFPLHACIAAQLFYFFQPGAPGEEALRAGAVIPALCAATPGSRSLVNAQVNTHSDLRTRLLMLRGKGLDPALAFVTFAPGFGVRRDAWDLSDVAAHRDEELLGLMLPWLEGGL